MYYSLNLGGYATTLGSSIMQVCLLQKCFLKDDYKNARYHLQRLVYLASVAKHLQQSHLVQNNIEYCAKYGHPIRSCLLVHPEGSLSSVSVYIYAVPNTETFKLSRFLPDKCNVRKSWWISGEIQGKLQQNKQNVM